MVMINRDSSQIHVESKIDLTDTDTDTHFIFSSVLSVGEIICVGSGVKIWRKFE